MCVGQESRLLSRVLFNPQSRIMKSLSIPTLELVRAVSLVSGRASHKIYTINFVRDGGIEPPTPVWKTGVIPFN